MSLENFKIRVAYDGANFELSFRNNDLVFSDKLEDSTGASRRSLDTELLFKSHAYEFLKMIHDSQGDCAVLDCEIREGSQVFYEAQIKLGSSKVKWDYDNCKVFIRLDANDDYTPFFDLWEQEFNIFEGTNRYTLKTNYPDTRMQTCEDFGTRPDLPSPLVAPISGCLENPVSWGVESYAFAYLGNTDDWRQATTWGRSEVTGAIVPGGDWVSVSSETPSVANFARPIFTDIYLNNEFIQQFNRVDEIPDGVLLNEILETFAPTGFNVVSDLFGINPSGNIPQNDVYNIAPTLHDILIHQKTSVKKYNSSDQVTEEGNDEGEAGLWSYKELLEVLAAQFNTDFRIVGTTIRIEHISFFEQKAQGVDAVAIKNGRFTKGRNQFSYDNSKVSRKEKWAYMEEVSARFSGKTIFYDCATSDDNDETLFTLNRVNNDIQYIVARPDKAADDGFVFVHASQWQGDYYLNYTFSENQSQLLPNYFLSLPNLIKTFHYYGRPFSSGTIDGQEVSFISQLRRKVQTEVRFPLCKADYLAYNAEDLIRTGLGLGEVLEATYSVNAEKLTVITRHD